MSHHYDHEHQHECCSHEHHHECCSHEHHHEHEHHHHHHHEHGNKQLITIIVGALLLVAAVIIEKTMALPTWQLLLVYMIPYLTVGHDTLKEAVEGLFEGNPMNEHFLMTIATIGALGIGFFPGAETEFPEAVFVMLFFQIGELFEGYAEGKSRASISHLMNIRPDIAHLEGKDLDPSEVPVGSVIVIRPGEKVPLDGVIVSGMSSLNMMALTGESLPRDVAEEDEVISGCINMSGVLRVRTTKTFGESTVSKIIRLVEDAGEHRSQSEAFITRFARVYTPIVVVAALLIAIVMPLSMSIAITGFSPYFPNTFMSLFSVWLYRALMFLVVSCPCALVISVPLTFFGGIGGASRKGILVKGANYLDLLAKVDTVVFDKTGTLTYGRFAVEAVHPSEDGELQKEKFDFPQDIKGAFSPRAYHLLHLAAHVEHFSTHPIGAALRDAFPSEATDGCMVTDVEEISGKGVRAKVGDKLVCVGNTKMMELVGAEWHQCEHDDSGTVIHVAIDGVYAGHIVINDHVKDDSADAIAQLKKLGVKKTVMLTGDRESVAVRVAQQLNIDEYHAELLPADKVEWVKKLKTPTNKTAFVGDGINDAPVLATADIGFAMGGLGSDAAIEAADVVVMDDQPSKVALAVRIARRTIAIARQNVIFAIGVKLAVLILAAFGLATMWLAVFADVGVTVLAVLNAMRALKVKSE